MSPVEIAAVLILAGIAALVLVRASRNAPRARWIVLAAILSVAAFAALPRLGQKPAQEPGARPRSLAKGEYLSSNACRSCHPAEHESWLRSHHRRMTEEAIAKNVRAPLDGRALMLDGRTLRLTLRGNEIWATLPDPDKLAEAALQGRVEANAPDVERRVALLTGSHHEQAYWVSGKREGELRLFPFVWMIAEQRFIPRKDAFLQPPDAIVGALRWNSNCIGCHAVGGRPGHDPERDAFETSVVELGIACEACHGPAGAHVARFQDPIERYAQAGKRGVDPTIKNPAFLDPEASAAVCGQCHSYAFPRDEDEWWSHGYALSYRPGQTLARSRTLFTLAGASDPAAPRVEAATESLFWADGAIRVGGREYNALMDSPCYQQGVGERRMTCLSCHSMHSGEPNDQLIPTRSVDASCLSCHDEKRGSSHSHHADGSSGSACVNCHQPYTTYALFKAIRSHRIDSPSVATTLKARRPNACNLCHLNRSLSWVQSYLESWYGMRKVDIPSDEQKIPAIALDTLRGDAALRAIAAAALGWEPALAVSPKALSVQLLAELLVDDYSAVRFVASRSLRALPELSDIPYDFLAPPSERERARTALRGRLADRKEDVLLDEATLRALLAARDNRPVTIAE